MLRTPLARVRGLGSARDGTHHFIVQRVTAVALVPLSLWFVAGMIGMAGADLATVREWMASPLVSVPFLLLIVAGFWHLKLGVQVVIEDYVHGEGAKIAAQMANTFFCALVGVACTVAVLKLAL